MSGWLKQSTAVTLKVGPFLDDTDGKTPETALTISQADVRLSKNGGNYAQKNESSAGTHDELGDYYIDLDATDTNTLGLLKLQIQESGALPVWDDFIVLPANVYDSLVLGTDNLQIDQVQLGGSTQSSTDLKDFADDGYDPSTNKVEGVKTVDTTTTNTDMRGTDNAALAATALSTAVWTAARAGYLDNLDIGEVVAGLSDITGLNDFDPANDTVALVTLVQTTTTNTDMRGTDGANTVVPDPAGTAPTASVIADAVLDEVLADLADNDLNVGESMTARIILRALFNRFYREVTQTSTQQTVKNDSGGNVAVMATSDDGTTQTKGNAT